MARLEVEEETKKRVIETGSADLLIAIAGAVNPDELRARTNEALSGLPGLSGSNTGERQRAVVAYSGLAASADSGPDITATMEPPSGDVRLLPYTLSSTPSVIPLLATSSTYQTLFGIARELNAGTCVVLAPDLSLLKGNLLKTLLSPILEQNFDLAMPIYPVGKFEGLLSLSILAPLTRALYGKRVRFPLAPDFAISSQFLPALEQPLQRITSQGQTLFWPATEAALRNRKICEVHLDAHHQAAGDNVDLSTVLSQTVAPLFAEMEANAPQWQRTRGSQPIEIFGTLPAQAPDTSVVDARPMIETFNIGFHNLQEVWAPVLPPVSLLELKRMSRMSPELFRMPDDLWVRIVYDFALAYRLRTLNRSHLLGALTPLYLGWVASYALEAAKLRRHELEQRVERLARAYEEGKPYLLSRWRWPDRFNP